MDGLYVTPTAFLDVLYQLVTDISHLTVFYLKNKNPVRDGMSVAKVAKYKKSPRWKVDHRNAVAIGEMRFWVKPL